MSGKAGEEWRGRDLTMIRSSREKRSRILLGGTALALLCWLLPVPGASALEPAANWKVTVQTNANLEPGPLPPGTPPPTYFVRAKNVGAAPTSGEYVLTEQLPPGLTISWFEGGIFASGQLSCEALESTVTTVTCRGEEAIQPGRELIVSIPVEVSLGHPKSRGCCR